jgi:hypothetical protein
MPSRTEAREPKPVFTTTSRFAPLLFSVGLIAALTLAPCSRACAAEAQPTNGKLTPPTIQAVYVETPPTIDGQLDDDCWSQASRLEGFFLPGLEQEVPEETIALICVDDQAVYAAVICRDRTPGDIVATETRRNGEVWNDDLVELGLDPWHGHKEMYYFQVTARGTQCEHIPGGSATKIEWRGDWTAASSRTDDGWQAEIAVPFSILRYRPGQDTFGFTIGRHFAEERLWSIYPIMGTTYDPTLTADLAGLHPPAISARPILMPYITADFGDFVGRRFDTGLDVQYHMPSGLTALASINPDFKQIEEVVEPISFSYTERYLPEVRPFFTTGQQGFFPREHLLYTRRIEDFDVGVKLFGTVGNDSIGLLDATTLGSENALAGAWRHSFDDDTHTKLQFVSHRKAGELGNVCYGLDAGHDWRRPNGSDALWFVLYQSRTQGARPEGSYAIGGNGHRVRGPRNIFYDWDFIRVTPEFDPPLGYYPDTDYIGGGLNVGTYCRHEEGALQGDGGFLNFYYRPRLVGDGILESGFSPVRFWDWRNGRSAHVGFTLGRREGYGNSDLHSHYGWNERDMYRRGSIFGLKGSRQGGDYTYYSAEQGFHPYDRVSVRVNAAYSHLTEPAEDAGHEYQTVLTASYDITPEKCIAARGIWRDAGFTAYASYRQVVRRGMDAYVILGDPDPDKTGFAHRLALKLIWTF